MDCWSNSDVFPRELGQKGNEEELRKWLLGKLFEFLWWWWLGGGGGLKNTHFKSREQNRGVVGALKIVRPTVSFPTTTLTQLGH